MTTVMAAEGHRPNKSITPRAGGRAKLRTSLLADLKREAIISYVNFCEGREYPQYPLEIFLEVSNLCDLKCAMCPEFSALNPRRLELIKGKKRGFLAEEDVRDNIGVALQHALVVHCFGYGEPTIHPNFQALLEFIARYEVVIDFFTNGMHLSEELSEFLVDKGIDTITVSFSGATREMYENIYLGGKFEQVLDGIKRVADLKGARGSRYPIIQVNSLGFKDHVAQFDKFVELLADHGANVIHLKQLQPYRTIPELYEHVSIMRPEIEGAIIKRAVELGKQRGVRVLPGQYLRAGVADEQQYHMRVSQMMEMAAKAFNIRGPKIHGFGNNPIAEFREVAKAVVADRAGNRQEFKSLEPDAEDSLAQALLRIEAPALTGGNSPFYCMEPFKTLYVTRSGATKPCCFGDSHSWHLGDVAKADAVDVWRGTGYRVVREAIINNKYPMSICGECLRKSAGPTGHIAHFLINRYLRWHAVYFGPGLQSSVTTSVGGRMQNTAAGPQQVVDNARKGVARPQSSNPPATTTALPTTPRSPSVKV